MVEQVHGGEPVMKRFRFKGDKTVGERLIKEARLAREKAEQLPPGEEREDSSEEGPPGRHRGSHS
jgi:hypothetical protein